LKASAQGVLLTIADDGQGFDPGSIGSDHLGLGIMRERAVAVGASLMLTSRPGAGTEIVVKWPA
ncbi:MAG TPA: sensor histidine kinase, partial [Anaerolineae bacterium]